MSALDGFKWLSPLWLNQNVFTLYGGGGKGGGDTVIGFKYYLGVHMLLCHGTADYIREIIIGERQAWAGNAAAGNYQAELQYEKFIQLGDVKVSDRTLDSLDIGSMKAALRERVQNVSYGNAMYSVANIGTQGSSFAGQAYIWEEHAAVPKLINTSVSGQVTLWFVAAYGSKVVGVQVVLTQKADGLYSRILQAKTTNGSNLNFNFNTGGTTRKVAVTASTAPTEYTPFMYNGVITDVGVGLSSLYADPIAQYRIDKPNLFGGEKREGGVSGRMDFLFGFTNQGRNDYLAKFQGENCPAYRRLTSIVFRKFYWSAMNPYFKSVWVRVTRMSRWSRGSVWYPEKLSIISLGDTGDALDMNPAHIIYESLTDPEWGMGYLPSDIDDTSFMEAADTLVNERFGLSIMWSTQSSIDTFIQSVLDHIGGILQMSRSTGKFVLKLIRTDYDINELTNLNPDNILEFKSFQRAGFGDIANELVVTYRDRDENDKTVAVQDLASVQATGSIVSATRQYDGIKTAELAYKVAVRDLTLVSSPLAKLEVTTNRVLWNKSKGDVVTLTWPDLGINLVPFRIVDIKFGTLTSGKIDVQMVEDVFGLPQGTYDSLPAGEWVDKSGQLLPPENSRVVEAPYWSVLRNHSRADMDYLEPEYGFGVYLANRNEFTNPFAMRLYSSPTSGGTFKQLSNGTFCPTGTLLTSVGHIETTFYLDDFFDLDDVVLDDDNGFAWIDDEIVAIVSVNEFSGEVVVRRGCLDTVPAVHERGARMYFELTTSPSDPTECVAGEVVYYKATSFSGNREMELDISSEFSLTFDNRASRPYPPAQFKINSLYYPLAVQAATLDISWVHRNRLTQTVRLVDYSEGSITPEAGTSYNVRVYDANANTLLASSLANTGTSASFTLASGTYDLRVELESVRGGVTSLFRHSYTFIYNKP